MSFSDKIKSIWKNLQNRYAAYAAALVMGASAGSCVFENTSQNKDEKKNTVENVANAKHKLKVLKPVKEIKYVTDTLDNSGRTLLYYSAGKITRNYVEKNNMYRMALPLFSHEDWHAHNDEIKWRRRYKYTPFEYYKLCMHDEISANIAALLTTRFQYIRSEDKKKFAQSYKGRVFGFYFDEVAKGNIKPESTNPKDKVKEWAFIANGMQKAWMTRCAKGYMPSIYSMMKRYVGLYGFIDEDESRKNYEYVRKYMYRIGGVNFDKYMKQDIVPTDDRVYVSDCLKSIKSLRDDGAEILNYVNGNSPLLRQVGFEKQTEAFQHLLISAKLKHMLSSRSKKALQENPQIADICYRQIMYKFAHDKTFAKSVENFPSITVGNCGIKATDKDEYRKIISQMYTFKGVDLSENIQDFKLGFVPVHNSDFYSFNGMPFHWDFPMGTQIETNSAKVENTDFSMIAAAEKNKCAKKIYKKRESGWQTIEAPNYREPILTAAGKQDMAKIFATIDKFKSMPRVLKECDTAAQQQYFAQLKKEQQKDI